jgi:1-acyl-sn-glycerol-3-phosphate acyltransferase
MDGSDHPRSGKPSVSQLLQGLQKGLEILLFLAHGPIAPVAAGGSHHSLRKRREPPIVIPEVKPPALPPLVRRHKDGGDVLLRARLPQLEDAATAHTAMRTLFSPIVKAKGSAQKRWVHRS